MATAKKTAVKKSAAKKAATKRPAAKKTARKGIGLHIGLNTVDPKQYEGWDGPLAACENDANDMAALAKSRGIKPTVLITPKATRAAVLRGLRSAAKALKAGDLFFLSFSGHGGQIKDASGDEPDKKDETWCLFDGQLVDDELYFEFSKFAAGVRIVMLSDSCHSGSVARAREPQVPPGTRSKLMPIAVGNRVYAAHAKFYDKLQKDVAKQAGGKVADPDAALAQVATSGPMLAVAGRFKASLILVSGCQDNQTSLDGDHNGAFTEALLEVWANGTFNGDYAKLHARVKAQLPASQTPNLFTLGSVGQFIAERPFTV
jgi:hypothetical protein